MPWSASVRGGHHQRPVGDPAGQHGDDEDHEHVAGEHAEPVARLLCVAVTRSSAEAVGELGGQVGLERGARVTGLVTGHGLGQAAVEHLLLAQRPGARGSSEPSAARTSVVGVRCTPTRRTRSRWDSASTSTCVTPGTTAATSASTWRVARHGAQKAEENCSSVARSPSGAPMSVAVRAAAGRLPGVRSAGRSAGVAVDAAAGSRGRVGVLLRGGLGRSGGRPPGSPEASAPRTRWVPRKRPSVRARCAPNVVAAHSTTTTTQSPTPTLRCLRPRMTSANEIATVWSEVGTFGPTGGWTYRHEGEK